MKRNDLIEIKKLDISGISGKISKLKTEIMDLKLKKGVGKLTNLKEIKFKKRDLAQILTVLRQKELLSKLEEQNG